jgi:aryl-alcohol dehydrogenase (NADP+)
MFAWQFAQALAVSDRRGFARFVSMQNHYNLIYREEEREMLPLCRAEGIAVIPWSPLARGLLAGSRRQGLDGDSPRAKSDEYARKLYEDSDLEVADRVVETARRRDLPPARIALGWLFSRPGVTAPIVGASRMEHLDDAVASLDVSLSGEECRFLEEPYRPHAVRGHE